MTQAEGFGLDDLARLVASRWKLLLALTAGITVLTYLVTLLLPPVFTAKTTFIPPQPQQSSAMASLSTLGALGGLAGAAQLRSPAEQYVSLMQSARMLGEIIDQFGLMQVYGKQYRIDAQRALLGNVDISLGKRDGLITVRVEDHDAKRAADMANAFVKKLRALTSSLAITEAQRRRQFFEELLMDSRQKLSAAQQALEAGGFSEGALRAEPKAIADVYARLRAEVMASEVRLQMLSSSLQEGAPDVLRERQQLAALRQQLASSERTLEKAPSASYVQRYRDFKYQETLFEILSRQYETARVDESNEGPRIQVIDEATLPEKRSGPARTLIALGAGFVSLLLAIAGLALRRALAPTQVGDGGAAQGVAGSGADQFQA